MALFNDEGVITLDDLAVFETGLVGIASTHGINVETKIKLATDNIADRLMLWLSSGSDDPSRAKRRGLGLSDVVLTPSLRRWICFDALSRFFAEAYNVQLNTRFQGKWTEYQNAASEASAVVFMSGVGVVSNPLPRPMMPVISVQDGQAPITAVFVQTTWVDQNGVESVASPVNGKILSGSASIVVAMAEGATGAPETAVGWNVYASTSQDNLLRQTNVAIPIGVAWELPASGLTQGPAVPAGQLPDSYITFSKQIQRG